MDLCLFYSNLDLTLRLTKHEINSVIIDFETKGKKNRQEFYDTQINEHNYSDLSNLRKNFNKNIICRINGGEYYSPDEVNRVIDLGADEILLPMVQNTSEIENLFNDINNRCKAGILVETNQGVAKIEGWSQFDFSRIYFGLNDFAIDNNSSNIFFPIVNEIVKGVREKCRSIPFGFGGLTHCQLGKPIPSKLLLDEMVRTNCDFTFLRRSFYRDLNLFSSAEILESIKEEYNYAKNRNKEEIAKDFNELKSCILNYGC